MESAMLGAILVLVGCERRPPAAPEPLPVRAPVLGVGTVRWDDVERVLAIGPIADRTPQGDVVVQSHQRMGHERPRSPRIADVVEATPRPITVVYAQAPACVGRVTHTLLWSGVGGWHEALGVDGCPAGGALAVDGTAPGLAFSETLLPTEPTAAQIAAVSPRTIRQAWEGGGLTVVEAGDGAVWDTVVFQGDDVAWRHPRARPRRRLEDGGRPVIELVGFDGVQLVPVALPDDVRACRVPCGVADDACARAAAADEALARCSRAFTRCVGACGTR